MPSMGVNPTWISSNGGPMLLVHEDVAHQWLGTDGPEPWDADKWLSLGNDYSRACAVREPVGVIPVGEDWALVFGDEPNPITWVARHGGGFFVRWVFAPENFDVNSAMEAETDALPWSEVAILPVRGHLVLFDSAFSGVHPGLPKLRIALEPGSYRVQTAELAPDSSTNLLLHRLAL